MTRFPFLHHTLTGLFPDPALAAQVLIEEAQRKHGRRANLRAEQRQIINQRLSECVG